MDYLSQENKNISATSGTQLVPKGITMICLYNCEPNLILCCLKDNGDRRKLSDMIIILFLGCKNCAFLITSQKG